MATLNPLSFFINWSKLALIATFGGRGHLAHGAWHAKNQKKRRGRRQP
jgi:hypothetical protein